MVIYLRKHLWSGSALAFVNDVSVPMREVGDCQRITQDFSGLIDQDDVLMVHLLFSRGGRNRHKNKQGGGDSSAAAAEDGEPEVEVAAETASPEPSTTKDSVDSEKGKQPAEISNEVAEACPISPPSSSGDAEDPSQGLFLPEIGKNCPYVVKHSDVMGRYLVAARDIQPAEIILREEPLVIGPSQECKGLCIGCYQRIPDDVQPFRCESCGWPLCGRGCAGRGVARGHSTAECAAWTAGGLRARPPPSPLAVQAVMALRCLLLREADPQRWRRLQQMESHNAIRRALPELWRHNQAVVVDRIREDWKLADRFTEEEIHTVCGYLEVNSFEVGQNGTRALYPSAFLLAHDCVPNTSHMDDPDDFTLTVRAARRIPRGTAITLSYAYTLQGTMKRREHLRESKFFDCCCARCADPTELGSMASALKCPKCADGYLFSSAALDSAALWRCDGGGGGRGLTTKGKCAFELTAHSVRMLVDRINDELDTVDANSVTELEGFLHKYRNVVHPHHFLALSAKHSLAQLYGKAEGYTINELPDDLLRRKMEICKELLDVFDLLEPGLTRLRGVILYELHAPIMILATRGFEVHSVSRKDLASRLKQVVDCLDQAARILSMEPEGSSEALMGHAAGDALLRMRDWHRVVSSAH